MYINMYINIYYHLYSYLEFFTATPQGNLHPLSSPDSASSFLPPTKAVRMVQWQVPRAARAAVGPNDERLVTYPTQPGEPRGSTPSPHLRLGSGAGFGSMVIGSVELMGPQCTNQLLKKPKPLAIFETETNSSLGYLNLQFGQ